jgi:hypothetical protein
MGIAKPLEDLHADQLGIGVAERRWQMRKPGVPVRWRPGALLAPAADADAYPEAAPHAKDPCAPP